MTFSTNYSKKKNEGTFKIRKDAQNISYSLTQFYTRSSINFNFQGPNYPK